MSEALTVTDDRPPVEDLPPDPAAEPAAEPVADEVPLVEVGEIATAIRALGDTFHGIAGHPEVPEHWAFTDPEVDQLAPPVTALINRHARARAIAQRSPELAVALVLSRWGVRNARLSSEIRKAEAEIEADKAAAETAEPAE